MVEKSQNHSRIRWMTRTGLLVALLITLQWATAGTQGYAGQYITGSCVNCVLAIAALFGGVWSGVAVAVLSPFCAFLLGIGPKLIQIVPCIAIGNTVFVLCLQFIRAGSMGTLWNQICILAISAAAKFAVLYTAVVLVLIPAMGDALAPKQAQMFTVMFSWPQLITALLGGTAALLIFPVLKKAMK